MPQASAARRKRPGSVKPYALVPGETIGIVAPAGPTDLTALQRGINTLQGWGFDTVLAPSVTSPGRGYLAGSSDAARAADLNSFFRDPAVHGILCARGGYGCQRLLPYLDWDAVRENPKWFGGFSDITILLQCIEREAGMVTFHCPIVESPAPAMPQWNADGLYMALVSGEPLGEITLPDAADAPPIRTFVGGKTSGRTGGGNLMLTTMNLGTRWELDFRGRILFLEDVGEEPYRMDRMIAQLLAHGGIRQAAGIVFGHSPTCEYAPDGSASLNLLQVIEDLLVPLGIPLIYGFPCGHSKYRASIPMGVKAVLDADAGTLTINEAAAR